MTIQLVNTYTVEKLQNSKWPKELRRKLRAFPYRGYAVPGYFKGKRPTVFSPMLPK